MADADKDLKIRITTQADTPKLREYSRGVADLTKTTEGSTKAALGAVDAKRRWIAGLRGIGTQFPIFRRIAMAALNPVTAAIAGLTLAVRGGMAAVREYGRTWNTLNLPDIDKLDPARINARTQAMREYADALNSAADAAGSLEAQHARAMKAIEQSEAIIKGLGGETPFEQKQAGRRKAAELARQAANMQLRGRERLAESAGITIATAADDAANLRERNKQAEAAAKDIEETQKRINDLIEWESGGLGAVGSVKWLTRYGARTTFEEARQREDRKIGAAQSIIGGRDKFAREIAERDRLRSRRSELMTGGVADLAASSSLMEQARDTDTAAQIRFGMSELESGRNLVPSRMGAGTSVRTDVAEIIRSNNELLQRIFAAEREQNIVLTQRLNEIISRNRTQAE